MKPRGGIKLRPEPSAAWYDDCHTCELLDGVHAHATIRRGVGDDVADADTVLDGVVVADEVDVDVDEMVDVAVELPVDVPEAVILAVAVEERVLLAVPVAVDVPEAVTVVLAVTDAVILTVPVAVDVALAVPVPELDGVGSMMTKRTSVTASAAGSDPTPRTASVSRCTPDRPNTRSAYIQPDCACTSS